MSPFAVMQRLQLHFLQLWRRGQGKWQQFQICILRLRVLRRRIRNILSQPTTEKKTQNLTKNLPTAISDTNLSGAEWKTRQ